MFPIVQNLKKSSVGFSTHEPQENGNGSPIVAVVGAKGGVGATTIAVNLAAAISSQISTTVLDANFQQPDIGRMIGEEPPHSVLELMARAKDLDRHLLDACMQPVSGTDLNLTLLSPPLEGQSAVTASLSELAECLKEIRSFRKFWIVDMPRHLDKHFVTLVDQCDRILLVMEATVIGVAAAQRWLAILDDLGYERDRVACVLNRAGSKFSGVEQQLGKCFPNREIIRLPNASNLLWECSMHGKIPALSEPNHPYCKSIFKLAEQVRQSISVR